MTTPFLSRVANRLKREIASRLPQRVDPELPKIFASSLSALGLGEGDNVLLDFEAETLLNIMPARGTRGISANCAAQRIIASVRSVIGPDGLVCVPFHPISDPKGISHHQTVFAAKSASVKGLAQAVLSLPDSACSEAPVLAIAAAGKNADELVHGQIEAAPYAMGEGSPWAKLLHKHIKVIGVHGIGTANLCMLLPAHLNPEAYKRPSFFHKSFAFHVQNKADKTIETSYHLHACPFQAEYDLANYANFDLFLDYLDEIYGLYKKAQAGPLQLVSYDIVEQYDACLNEMNRDNYVEDTRHW